MGSGDGGLNHLPFRLAAVSSMLIVRWCSAFETLCDIDSCLVCLGGVGDGLGPEPGEIVIARLEGGGGIDQPRVPEPELEEGMRRATLSIVAMGIFGTTAGGVAKDVKSPQSSITDAEDLVLVSAPV